MKLLHGGLLVHLSIAIGAYARHGQVFLSNQISNQAAASPLHTKALSPTAARLALASRLGLSQFHDTKSLSEKDIEDLNILDGISDQLFKDPNETSRRKTLVVLEGVDHEAVQNMPALASFQIEDPPSPKQNKKLWTDLLAQRKQLEDQRSAVGSASKAHIERHQLQSGLKDLGFSDLRSEGHLDIAIGDCPRNESPAFLNRTFEHMLAWAKKHDGNVIIVTMPVPSKGSIFKRSSTGWGTYSLEPRSNDESKEFSETPVPSRPLIEEESSSTENSKTSTSSESSTSSASTSKSATSSGEYTGPTSPPRGILPSCFSTMRQCREATHNCSGHGSCDLQYNYKEKDDHTISCYACTCKNNVTNDENGRVKTTVWTGPACQKQDLTVPFWLLAGFTIGLVSLVYWAIGLLYSMGSEELPSVIGSGVAGPKAR